MASHDQEYARDSAMSMKLMYLKEAAARWATTVSGTQAWEVGAELFPELVDWNCCITEEIWSVNPHLVANLNKIATTCANAEVTDGVIAFKAALNAYKES